MISRELLESLKFKKIAEQGNFEAWYELQSKSFVFFGNEDLNLIDGDKEHDNKFLKTHVSLIEESSQTKFETLEKEIKTLQNWIDELLPDEPTSVEGYSDYDNGSIGGGSIRVRSSQVCTLPTPEQSRKNWK